MTPGSEHFSSVNGPTLSPELKGSVHGTESPGMTAHEGYFLFALGRGMEDVDQAHGGWGLSYWVCECQPDGAGSKL